MVCGGSGCVRLIHVAFDAVAHPCSGTARTTKKSIQFPSSTHSPGGRYPSSGWNTPQTSRILHYSNDFDRIKLGLQFFILPCNRKAKRFQISARKVLHPGGKGNMSGQCLLHLFDILSRTIPACTLSCIGYIRYRSVGQEGVLMAESSSRRRILRRLRSPTLPNVIINSRQIIVGRGSMRGPLAGASSPLYSVWEARSPDLVLHLEVEACAQGGSLTIEHTACVIQVCHSGVSVGESNPTHGPSHPSLR